MDPNSLPKTTLDGLARKLFGAETFPNGRPVVWAMLTELEKTMAMKAYTPPAEGPKPETTPAANAPSFITTASFKSQIEQFGRIIADAFGKRDRLVDERFDEIEAATATAKSLIESLGALGAAVELMQTRLELAEADLLAAREELGRVPRHADHLRNVEVKLKALRADVDRLQGR
jgi:hypothetical protein